MSLNPAPVMNKITEHCQNHKGYSAKKVLRLIKDIKNVALNDDERDFLKSYNVKQAMMWCLDKNPQINSETNLLMSTLHKIQEFYQQGTLPSFLEPQRNLIYKMTKQGRSGIASTKIVEIMNNVSNYMDQIEDVQSVNKFGISEVRNNLGLMAYPLQLPIVLNKYSRDCGWPRRP